MSAAPSARPVMANCGEGSVAAGVVKTPLELKLMLPVSGVDVPIGKSEAGMLRE